MDISASSTLSVHFDELASITSLAMKSPHQRNVLMSPSTKQLSQDSSQSFDRIMDNTPQPRFQANGIMTYHSRREPIPLITVQNNMFKINEQCEDLLSGLKGPIAIVSVAGIYRTGKSFILNQLLGRQDGYAFVFIACIQLCDTNVAQSRFSFF